MKIPNDILNKWKLLREHGDVKALCEDCKYSRPVIISALNGEATETVFTKVNEWYKQKEARQQQLLKSA